MKRPRYSWGLSATAVRSVARIAGFRRRRRAPAAAAAAAAGPPKIDSGDTAWMLTSTALVLLMTIPGPGAVLCRHGAQEERARDDDAVLRDLLHRHDRLDGRRLQHRLHHRQRRTWATSPAFC